MTEKLSEQIPHPMYIKTPHGERLLRPLIEDLERQMADEIESRDGWKEAWKKSKRRVAGLERIINDIAPDALAYAEEEA